MTKKKIDEFEGLYFEFSFSNGKRVIGTKKLDNIFEILFIDCNHLVCFESSRTPKIKMKYRCPSIFERTDKTVDIEEFDKKELFEMLIASLRNGDYSNIDEFIEDYDDLFACV